MAQGAELAALLRPHELKASWAVAFAVFALGSLAAATIVPRGPRSVVAIVNVSGAGARKARREGMSFAALFQIDEAS